MNPLLRRLQVLPPENYDNSYGGLIEEKRKKYLSGGQAFGVEGMGSTTIVVIILALFIGTPLLIIVLTVLTKEKVR